MIDKDNIDLLKYLHECQINEIRMRRSRELSIFLWTSTILVGLMSLLLITESTKKVIWEEYGIWGKIMAISIIILICIFSILGQNQERRYGQLNKRVVARLNQVLGFHDYREDIKLSLMDNQWTNWGQSNLNNVGRYFRANFVTYTWTLTLLNIIILILV